METWTSSYGLVERVKNGDRDAFTLLFDRYRPRLAVLIHYRLSEELRCVVEVDDVVQETFLKAFRDLDHFTYRSPGSLMRWLARIADHVLVDLARSQGRQKRHAAEMLRFRSESNPSGPEPVDSKTPSRLLAESEGARRLLDKLDSLPEDYRQAILLMKLEGLSTQEAAERLGKSKEATALLLHRAIKRFRSLQDAR
ncbi:MAG TPA: sigma-70 family RNA polymerase sigma factor [Candidatus Methylomirabilis sp.]|nr:sigma-70 family RNA polymerase sigma factor [Candidatus Methylomirabilis sp.]